MTRPAWQIAGLLCVLLLPGALRAQCVGDCDGDGRVQLDELVLGVAIASLASPLDRCVVFDPNGDGKVEVTDLIAAVRHAGSGCPRSEFQFGYTLAGTLDDQPATGSLTFSTIRDQGPNLAQYTVDSFTFGSLTGAGIAEFSTLYNTMRLYISARKGQSPVTLLRASARVVGTAPLSFDEFSLSGGTYRATFLATRNK